MSEAMQRYYAQRAPIYDAVYAKPERQAELRALERRLPRLLAGRAVLEVACGTGYWTQFIAPRAARLTATDINAEPLALARQRPGVERVTFAQADAYALRAALGTFDAAFAGLWFSHVPIERRGEFLRGLHARLAPGALVVLLDNTEAQLRDLPLAERDAAGNTWQHRVLPDGSVHRVLKNFPTREELHALVAGIATQARLRRGEHFWEFRYRLAA
ncbi:MAG: class I SAM-dependent methyltransferase [Burkholderiales bacterium]|jgi:SAM-dependent methyltransferase|nr:class I SAM-dependent methyltransferase [Burkholderiales bacterium]